MNLSLLLSQLFNGLQTGSIYALVALGYSMVASYARGANMLGISSTL